MKKLMSATIILLPLIILAIMLVSGAIMSLTTHIYVEKVEFSDQNAIILVMDDESNPPTYDLSSEINIFPAKAQKRDIVFASKDESLVKVNEEGVITAVFYGETYVTVQSVENKAAIATRKVIVTDDSVHAIALRGGVSQEMYEGDTQKLSVDIFPKEAENKLILWSSSDSSVLTVSANGTVTAVGGGTATITAVSDDNPEARASVQITCYPEIDGVQCDDTDVLTSYTSISFPKLTILPGDSGMTVTYSSSDESIATVNAEGLITFKKEGKVTVTATVTDFGGKSKEAKKNFASTMGYYTGPLFEDAEYTVDYDEFANGGTLPIKFISAPEGAHQQIKEVIITPAGILNTITDENKNFHFEREMPVGLKYIDVKVTASVYDGLSAAITDYNDGFRLYVTRNAQSVSVEYNGLQSSEIQTNSKELTFINGSATSSATVKVQPENHTNNIVYSITSGVEFADITEEGTLKFHDVADGTDSVKVTVHISLVDEKDVEHAGTDVDVTYTPQKPGDKQVDFTKDSETEKFVELDMLIKGNDTGVILVNTADGATLSCTADESGVVEILSPDETHHNYRISPLKGGFATVTVTAKFDDDRQTINRTVKVFVNRELSSENFTVTPQNNFRTSLETVNCAISLNGITEDYMAGKEIYVSYGDTKDQLVTLSQAFDINFGGKSDIEVTFDVRYNSDVSAFEPTTGLPTIAYKFFTTKGRLDEAPTVTYNDTTLQFGSDKTNNITISNINEQITLSVQNSFSPADFDIKGEYKTSLDANESVGVTISEDCLTVTLTGNKKCENEKMRLTIGGKECNLSVTVISISDQIEVKYGDKTLNGDQTYNTLLNSLTFTVTPSRSDSKEITDKAVKYYFPQTDVTEPGEGADWKDFNGTIEFDQSYKGIIWFRSSDGGAQIKIKIDILEKFDYTVALKCDLTSEDSVQFGNEIDTSKLSLNGNMSFETKNALPADMKSVITLKIGNLENYLGKVGEKDDLENSFKEIFKIDDQNGWTVGYNSAAQEITVTIKPEDVASKFTDKSFTLTAGGYTLELHFSLGKLQSIVFKGFDSNNKENGGDVYKGYQQVRVFAKHSDYGKGAGMVDYFEMPYSAYTNVAKNTFAGADEITWKLYSVNSNTNVTTLLVEQNGTQVKYYTDGETFETYTVVKSESGDSKLYKGAEKDGTLVAEKGNYAEGADKKIPWIDVFAVQNGGDSAARIYFGDFAGLSEVDVQNDYFGNFGEKEGWKKVEQTVTDAAKEGSGRNFTPSANAYTFLKAEAGDGAKDYAHFNFNVLADDNLVNVFNAAGYINTANKKIVLHSNLYGPEELGGGDATPDILTINSTDSGALGKTLIYGNGYQVNLQAKNKALCDELKDKENTGTGRITFGTLYNVTLKGTNPTDEVGCKTHKILMSMNGAYYSDLQYYSKMNPVSTKMFIKNTVLRYVANAAVQLYQNAYELYFENVTIAECLRAVSIENNKGNKIYYKGFFDTLNYNNSAGLQSMFAQLNGGTSYSNYFSETGDPSLVTAAKEYLEWFGKDGNGNGITDKRYYTNVIIIGTYSIMPASHERLYWNEETMTYSKLSIDADKLYDTTIGMNMGFVIGANVTIYNTKSDVDGGSTDYNFIRNDMNKLFTEERDIRLLCQYKRLKDDGTLEKNTDHILWHMNKVHRDTSLIEGYNDNHIDDLKESLKNTTWFDGSYVDENGDPHDPPADALAAYEALSQAVVPADKKEYCI